MNLADQIQEALISASLKHYRAQTRNIEKFSPRYAEALQWLVAFPKMIEERRGKEDPAVLKALEETVASKQATLQDTISSLPLDEVMLPIDGLWFHAGVYLPVRVRGRVPLEDALLDHARASLVPGTEKPIHEYVLLKCRPTPEQIRSLISVPPHLRAAGVRLAVCGLHEYDAGDPGRVLYERVLAPSHEQYGLIPIPSSCRREFPKLHTPFVVETSLGNAMTHTTTPTSDEGFGERFAGEKIKELYTEGVLKAGTTVRVSVLESKKRYKIETV